MTDNDQHLFILTDKEWQEMEKIMDAPLRDTPKLQALINTPSVFGKEMDND